MHSQALQQHTLSTTCIHKWFFTIKRPRYYGIMVPLPFWVRSLSGHIKPQKMLNLNSKTLRDVVLCLSRGYLKIFRNNVNECWDLHHGTNMGGEVHPRSLYILIELTSCQRKKTHTHTHTQIELTSCQRKNTHTHTHTQKLWQLGWWPKRCQGKRLWYWSTTWLPLLVRAWVVCFFPIVQDMCTYSTPPHTFAYWMTPTQ
jgi:hypothetical protein